MVQLIVIDYFSLGGYWHTGSPHLSTMNVEIVYNVYI